jgi:hypothetical protein
MKKIDLFTVASKETEHFSNLLMQSANALSSGAYQIGYKCFTIGNNVCPGPFDQIISINEDFPDNAPFCLKHGHALNKIKENTDADYIMVLDADVAFTYLHWDNVISDELSQYDIFGGNFSNNSQRYRGFPSSAFICFRSNIFDKTDIDFRPSLDQKWEQEFAEINNDYLSEINCLPKGSMVKMGVGCLLPEYARTNQLTFNSLVHTEQIHERALEWTVDERKYAVMHDPKAFGEWHYRGKCFASHFGGINLANESKSYGSNPSYNEPTNYDLFYMWENRIKHYIRHTYIKPFVKEFKNEIQVPEKYLIEFGEKKPNVGPQGAKIGQIPKETDYQIRIKDNPSG